MKMKKFVLLFAMLFSLSLLSSPAWCSDDEEDGDEFMLEEITVTAQKREENQQKVAIAMEVVSAEQLKASGKNDLDEILSGASNAIINKATDGLRISLRGVSDDQATFHGQSVSMPTVAVNMDGVYSNRKDSSTGLFDLERVEVLYGPQSTMYSSNSPGGIVNVVSANPKLDSFSASASLEVGNYNLIHTEGSVNAPITETTALRAAFSTSKHDGYISNGGDDENSKSARLKGLYEPNEKLSITVTGELTKTKYHGYSAVTAFVDQDDADPDPWTSDSDLGSPSESTNSKIYANMNLETGIGSLSLVPSYSKRSGESEQRMTMGTDVTVTKGDDETEEKSMEVRMSSPADFFFKWIVGVNYYNATNLQDKNMYDGDGNLNMVTLDTGETIAEFRYTESEEESTAIFANATYPLTDALRGTLGYRYSWDDVALDNTEVKMIQVGDDAGLYELEPDPQSHSYSAPDYKVGLEYDLASNAMLYADYSTSYRVQAMGSGSPGSSDEEAPPEELNSYTLGAKTRFLDNKLQMNVAAYYYDYENFSAGDQVTAYVGPYIEGTTDPDPNQFSSTATEIDEGSSTWGDGRMIGIDLSTTAIITAKDILNLSVSYMKSEWTDLYFDYENEWQVSGVGPGETATFENIVALEDVSYNGKPMTSSPEWTINLGYSHRFALWNGGSLEGKVEGRYKSSYRLTWKEIDYPTNYQEGFYTVDLSSTYNNPTGRWSLSAYVRNLTDYAEKRMYMGDPINEMTISSPRTYGAVLSAHF